MRTTLLYATLFLASTAHATEVGERPLGLGLMFGNPVAVSGKYYLGSRMTAIDAALGVNTWGPGDGSIYLHATWLMHPGPVYDHPAFTLPWHFGVGAFVADYGNTVIGARGVLGLDMDLHDYPVQFFGDLSLTLSIPGIDPDLGFQIGGRYYF